MTTIENRYIDVKTRIATAALKSNRQTEEVTLVVVSKTFSSDEIKPVLEMGHINFGENRVQESQSKWPLLKSQYNKTCLHLIGPLQTNKAREAVELFDCIQTLDREKLAKVLSREIELSGKNPEIFIQVNTGEEDQKAGILPVNADAFIRLCIEEYRLNVTGLMCIPPVSENPKLHFEMLGEIAKRNDLKNLSMGMSGDYETAIKYGATHVRVGSAIFGSRS